MTDEEMKQYADDHWKCVVYCKECKHMVEWESPVEMSPIDIFPIDICDRLKVSVSPNFWCAEGRRKK